MGSGPASRRSAVLRQNYWRNERLFIDGDSWFESMISDLQSAVRRIDFEVYIFEDDVVGARICAALSAAAERGVQVRLLVDGAGASDWIWRRASDLMSSSLALRVYHPLPSQMFSPAFFRNSRLLTMMHQLVRINRRDHRKQTLIDGRIAWVGSFNASAKSLRTVMGDDDSWYDAGARVEGPAINELEEAFAIAWESSWRFNRAGLRSPGLRPRRRVAVESGLVRLNQRLRQRRRRYEELIRRLNGATQQVWIAMAYFVPGRRLIRALGDAATRGVDVRLMMSERSDIPFMPWVAVSFQSALLSRGVRILNYKPRFLHAKIMLIDDWLSVGSTNLNARSLIHDLEADVVLLSPASLRRMREIFREDFRNCKTVSQADCQARPWYERILAWLALRYRYYL